MNKLITYNGERKEKPEGYWKKCTSPSTHFCIVLTFEIILMFYVFEKLHNYTKLTTMGRYPKSEYKQQQQQQKI